MATAAVVVLLLVAAASYGVVSAQTPAGAPGPASNDCFTALMNVSACLTYVEDGSKLAKPDKGCCPELAGLVDSNPICLCQLLGNPGASPVKLDYNKALKLPSVCGVSTPPVSTCSAVGVPVALPPSGDLLSPNGSPKASASATSPSPSDAATATGSPGSQPSGAEEAAATTPSSPANNNNGALSIKASLQPLIFGFAITAFASIF